MNEQIMIQEQQLPSISEVSGTLDAHDIIKMVQTIDYIKRNIMKRGEHFGQLFTKRDDDKKQDENCEYVKEDVLFKAGADLLAVTFRIRPEYTIMESMRNIDISYYAIKCIGSHINTGKFLGEGIGSCSSHESKYMWRKSLCDEEYACFPPDKRREHFYRYYNKKLGKWDFGKEQQVRTDSADLDNTILKMAKKRAFLDMIITVTASSGLWTQDLEDLPPEIADEMQKQRPQKPPVQPTKPHVSKPQATNKTPQNNDANLTNDQIQSVIDTSAKYGIDADRLFEHVMDEYNVGSFNDLRQSHLSSLFDWIKASGQRADAPQNPISESQAKRVFAIARGNGYDNDDIKSYLEITFNINSTKLIDRSQYDEIVEYFQTPKEQR